MCIILSCLCLLRTSAIWSPPASNIDPRYSNCQRFSAGTFPHCTVGSASWISFHFCLITSFPADGAIFISLHTWCFCFVLYASLSLGPVCTLWRTHNINICVCPRCLRSILWSGSNRSSSRSLSLSLLCQFQFLESGVPTLTPSI